MPKKVSAVAAKPSEAGPVDERTRGIAPAPVVPGGPGPGAGPALVLGL
jgi:hypothetical protein